tara:strand:+ start:16366 stop:17286 length:921 start_codon:yes stop_codon:yes gene_type:complete
MNTYQDFFNDKVPQLRVLLSTQWDYLTYANVIEWLDDNFKNDSEGRYYALKILLNLIYYSKRDLEELLDFGLHEKIYGEIVKEEYLNNHNIYIPTSEAEAKVNELKEHSYFVPLLDSNKPHESGNSVIGDLVHKISVNESQVGFHWNIKEEFLQKFKLLIFVDDCVGSGSQLKKFWNSTEIEKVKVICQKYDIKIYYLVLIGYDKKLEILKKDGELKGIKVVVCDTLSDKNRIFSNENTIWDKTNNEIQNAVKYFEKIRKERGVSFLGFKKLDFAVILHDRLPNWSLPILWKETDGWKCLLRRKTS